MANSATYTFADVHCSIVGPGGSFALGAGAGNAEEGISVEFSEELDNMYTGADGSVVHSLRASRAGKITVRLMKTSPVNYQLNQMCQVQRSSSLFHGQNTISISNPVSGDTYTCSGVAFARNPPNAWGKDAGLIEWEFNAARIEPTLGGSILSALNSLGNSPNP